MNDHPFGWWSFLPPIVAIVLAIATRRVILSLLIGIFAGSLVLSRGDIVIAVGQFCQQHLWSQLLNRETLHIFCFTLLMGAMVGIINKAAGMRGLVEAISPIASTRRRGQLATWFLGLFVFFDDYANTMLLGHTLRPLCDRLRISREKLAYLVDSTAAPVSGLALVSTWVAGEIGYVTSGIQNIDADVGWNPFVLFVESIPYRFYVLWTLLFVPMVAILGRDFGPMRRAEQLCLEGMTEDDDEDGPLDSTAPDESTPARWFNAVIPILVTVCAVVYFLYASGLAACSSQTVYDRMDWSSPEGITAEELPESLVGTWTEFDSNGDVRLDAEEFARLREARGQFPLTLADIFGNADSYGSLLWGALAGAFTALILVWPQRLVATTDLFTAAGDGAGHMLPALGILWLASCLSVMTGNSPNEEDAAEIARLEIVFQTMQDAGQSPAEAAAYAQSQGFSANAVAMTLLEASDNVMELRARLVAAGYREREIEATMKMVVTDSEGRLRFPFPYSAYRLYSGQFLTSQLAVLQGRYAWVAENFTQLLPSLIFILSSLIAFSTGTSWGTMGIVMPLVIPLAHAQLATGAGDVSSSDPILLCSIGGVLAGAIFGDHCSPISDTTVLSSQASGCDHVAHVRTQMPYALTVGAIAVLCGTLPVGYGMSVWLTQPLGFFLMLAALRVLGRPTEV